MIFIQALCAENQEIETCALDAITALMQLIGKSIQNDETEISTKKFVDRAIRGTKYSNVWVSAEKLNLISIILECEKFLKEFDLKLVWPATKVLQAVARANSTCSSLIWAHMIPLLVKQFNNIEQVKLKIFRFTYLILSYRSNINKQFLIWLHIFFNHQVEFLFIPCLWHIYIFCLFIRYSNYY